MNRNFGPFLSYGLSKSLYFVVLALITRKKKSSPESKHSQETFIYHIPNTSTFPFLSDFPRRGGRGGRTNEKQETNLIVDGPEAWNDDSQFVQIPIT